SGGSIHLLADVAGYFIGTNGTAGNGATVKSLGRNAHGDLGDGTNTDSSTPVDLLYLHDTMQVDGYGLGLTHDGHVWGWGPDMLAQLYANKSGSTDEGYNNCSIPTQIGGLNSIVKVAGSPADGFAMDTAGKVFAW